MHLHKNDYTHMLNSVYALSAPRSEAVEENAAFIALR